LIRVLHFIPGYGIGGVESLILSLYKNIDKTRIQFDFLVETDLESPDFSEIKRQGGNVYHLKALNKRKPFQYIRQVKLFFEQQGHLYSIVHCHNTERAVVVLYFARKSKICGRVMHAHTDSFKGANYERISKFIMRLNNRLSTHYLACSQSAGHFQFKKDKKPFIVFKNSIDIIEFSYSAKRYTAAKLAMNLSKCFVVGHTGRFAYAKNHSRIIDIFFEVYQRLPFAHLLLVGDGPSRPDLERKVHSLGLSTVVTFAGERNDIAETLHCMDVFLLPSLYEGFCISLLEAQAAGLKCFASDIIPPEVALTELVTKLSLNESNEKWAESILTNRQYIRTSHDDEITARNYDAQSNSNRLLELYLAILE
jgi:glycosyltransferase involved in cell wall biosynthesis